MTTSEWHSSGQAPATGPLTVSAANPRYFTAASGGSADQKAVYLTGSHIWNNLHDGSSSGPRAAGGDFHLCTTPQPWPRTGPGAARDGEPRFDLDRFDEAFFARLRDRVAAAGQRGIYVAVMLFDGWARTSARRPIT